MAELLWPPSFVDDELLSRWYWSEYSADRPDEIKFLHDKPWGDPSATRCGIFWMSHACDLAAGHEGDHQCWTEDWNVERWLLCCCEPQDSDRLFR